MIKSNSFFSSVLKISVPVALQFMLQSSFSIVDQLMIGRLGSTAVAAIGIAGKFSSIFTVVTGAVGAAAGIMISQYIGAKDSKEADKSFLLNLTVSLGIGAVFTAVCLFLSKQIMGIYTQDTAVIAAASSYLKIVSISYLPLCAATLTATLLRCIGKAALPLYVSIAAALVNTGLNYILIFGRLGTKAMGVNGAAAATAAASVINLILLAAALLYTLSKQKKHLHFSLRLARMTAREYIIILFPILVNELLWSVGENVYAAIYGRLGTLEAAAMALTYPVQALMIGALSGFSQAAGILIGKELGAKQYDSAYAKSKKLMLYGAAGALALSVLLIVSRGAYAAIYSVEEYVKTVTAQLLIVFALVSPVKVINMILGGGILRSGGRTRPVMLIDILGTWCFGIPLALLGAFVLKFSIPYVYFLLSLEEAVRLLLSLVIFKKRNWMHTI